MIKNRKVCVRLSNGFGNNLFQYVAAKNLGEFHKAAVVAVPPHKGYYGIPCLEKLGVVFDTRNTNNKVHHVNDSNYVSSFCRSLNDCDFIVSGYFEHESGRPLIL